MHASSITYCVCIMLLSSDSITSTFVSQSPKLSCADIVYTALQHWYYAVAGVLSFDVAILLPWSSYAATLLE